MPFEVRRERVGGVLVAVLEGRLDNESAADFELFAAETVAAGERHLVLDMSGLGYISHAGARALATLAKSMSTPTTSLRVAGLRPPVRQALDAAGVSLLLDLRETREAALADHPATRGAELGPAVMRLLGIEPDATRAEPDPEAARLAELAASLLTSDRHHNRAARAIAQGTQVMRRIASADVAAAGEAPAAPARRPDRRPWWKRLFGIGRS
ncbi:MAG: hypothetical protein KatS3mg126_0485 [Lysobacteraceae bacterium]|nr:MAG: hypothetical protein KatS3mg126_0485 [Xanthomonadaceae bacterium]